MSHTIRCVQDRKQPAEVSGRDSLLIEAYLNNTPSLHPRRTLDQFFYHGIDTAARDVDQYVSEHPLCISAASGLLLRINPPVESEHDLCFVSNH